MKVDTMHLKKLGKRTKRVLAVLPIMAAIAVVIVLVRTRSGPEKRTEDEISRTVRIIDAPAVALIPRATGYGLAEPGRIWRAMAEVKGTVVSTHPQLEAGALIDEGATLLKINPADYELAIARLEASISETRAKLEQLKVEEKNKKSSLEIEKESLALAKKSLDRLQELVDKKAVPADQVDREQRNVLQQQQLIQKIENQLALIPTRREGLKAALAIHQADLEQARIDLGRTEIKAPFDCRLAEVKIERGQFLNAGQKLFEAHGTGVVEVEAKFRPEQMRDLLAADKRRRFQPGMTMETLRELFVLEATIRLRSGDWEATWPARFDRIRETVDPRTRAINVVSAVDNPYEKVIPGVRPALVRGMYCEMELRAPVRPGTVVLPRSAIRGDRVFVVDNDGRLQSKKVAIDFAQSDIVALKSGVEAGETVVISDPEFAIEGMKVNTSVDSELRERLVQQAEMREVSQ